MNACSIEDGKGNTMSLSNEMASQHWEYCALVSYASEMPDEPGSWLCRVSYFTTQGVKTVQLREHGSPFPTDVFERAMAQLGAGGWELVSLQHELVRNNINVTGERFLATVHTGYSYSPFGVAYFKRPTESGRAIDEPPIVIEAWDG
jgi:hypothetical protein